MFKWLLLVLGCGSVAAGLYMVGPTNDTQQDVTTIDYRTVAEDELERIVTDPSTVFILTSDDATATGVIWMVPDGTYDEATWNPEPRFWRLVHEARTVKMMMGANKIVHLCRMPKAERMKLPWRRNAR
jgi:hypothetical protein